MNKNNQKLKEWEKHEPLDFNTVPLAESREILISILPPLERITKDAEAKRLLGDAHIVQVSDESVRKKSVTMLYLNSRLLTEHYADTLEILEKIYKISKQELEKMPRGDIDAMIDAMMNNRAVYGFFTQGFAPGSAAF